MSKQRIQLRRCSVCQKLGHNKSTCPTKSSEPNKIESKIPTSDKQPLRFYVHHVADEPKKSQNIIDLKQHNIWNEVDSCSPFLQNNKTYHSYHNTVKKSPSSISTPIKSDNNSINFLPTTKRETKEDNKINFKLPAIYGLKDKLHKLVQYRPNLKIKNKINISKQTITNKTHEVANGFLYHIREWQKIYFPLKRTLVSLTIFSLIIFAPTHAQSYYQNLVITAQKIKNDGGIAYSSLEQSTSDIINGDIEQAQKNLSASLNNFDQIIDQMQNSNKYLQSFASYIPILKDKVHGQQSLVYAGQKIAEGNVLLLKTLDNIKNSSSTLLTNIEIIDNNLDLALPYYKSGLEYINQANPDILPESYQSKFTEFKNIYSAFVGDLIKIKNSTESIKVILGGKGTRRYLLIFQNQHEIRPTGGFIGSMAMLEIQNGKISKLDVPPGGSYDLQGLLDEYVEPPAPLLMVANRWHFRDANWFADFPSSAEKLMWFYRHSQQITTDGVIAINSSVLERILKVTGPIIDEERGLELTANNAIKTIQEVVEDGPEKISYRPKQIIGDLASKFISDFESINSKNALSLLDNFQEALAKKEIQMYFTDEIPKSTVDKYSWNGKITKTDSGQDYLMVVNANINGRKSDYKIKQKIAHQSLVQEDGTIINTVTITRTHTGENGEEYYGYPNTNYLRLYTPLGSKLLKAGGFTWLDDNFFKAPSKFSVPDKDLINLVKETKFDPLTGTQITTEFDKTAFGNWVVTEPGKTSVVYFTYQLPFKIDPQTTTKTELMNLIKSSLTTTNYQLIAQKQSGVESKFESTIIFPNKWTPTWNQGNNMKLASNGAIIEETDLDTDKVWSLIMKTK